MIYGARRHGRHRANLPQHSVQRVWKMLGRKNYTQEEFDHGKATIKKQLAAYKKLAGAIAGGTTDKKLRSELKDFEGFFFNNLTLVLDRYYVHRLRTLTSKNRTPLNEVG